MYLLIQEWRVLLPQRKVKAFSRVDTKYISKYIYIFFLEEDTYPEASRGNRYNRAAVKATGHSHSRIKYFIFSIPRSGNKAERSVMFRRSKTQCRGIAYCNGVHC